MAGFLSRMLERRSLSLTDAKQWSTLGLSTPTAAGIPVTPEGSLKYPAVQAAVRVLAESVASLPLITYERLPGEQGKVRARDFYLYRLLHDKPNPFLDSFVFRELLQTHLLLWGNAYCEIESDASGRITALWPLLPGNMQSITRSGDVLVYEYMLPDGRSQKMTNMQILHLRGLGVNGYFGLSPIALARQSIGLGLAAEQFGATFFGNGANMSGVLSHPMVLGDEAFESLRKHWEETYSGIGKAHRVAILEEGMKYERIGIPPEDAQFLETRKFQVTEIARIFRVPPHMIGDLERATFSNVEQQALEFVTHSLRPWLVRWEMAIHEQLFTEAERVRYFAEFLVDGLLRGDIASRYGAYAIGRQNGWLSANDIRRLENMNPVENGDMYLVPLNMIPADQVGQGFPSTEPTEPVRALPAPQVRVLEYVPQLEDRTRRTAAGRHRLQQLHIGLMTDTAARVLRREANDVGNAAKRMLGQRTVPEFQSWLDDFYAEHATFTARQWLPVLQAYAGLVADEVEREVGQPSDPARYDGFIASYAEQLGNRQAQRSRARLDEILAEFGEDAQSEIESTMLEWRTERPVGVGGEESVRSGNAFAVALYGFAGVRFLRWVAMGKTCAYCSRLDGKVVGITQPFLPAGVPFANDAPNGALTPSRNIGHAPAHRGCLPGDSLVLTRGGIAASSERWFDGDLVVIQTAAGYELSCTPNHPVLTDTGWVAAGALNVGDYVISDRSVDWESGRNVHSQNVPALIHDVVKSVGGASNVMTMPMPTTAEDFHGDGANSVIAVIRTNGDLLDMVATPFVEQLGEFSFQSGYADPSLLAGQSAGAKRLKTVRFSNGSLMGGCDLCSSVLVGSAFPDEQLSVGVATWSDASFQQMPADNATRDAELLGQGQFGVAGQVFADEVIAVKFNSFHGLVYNLETEKGYYIANGIVVHNCDCQVIAG